MFLLYVCLLIRVIIMIQTSTHCGVAIIPDSRGFNVPYAEVGRVAKIYCQVSYVILN